MNTYKHIAECLDLTFACLIIEYPALDDFFKFQLASVAEIIGYAANKACDVAWSDSPSRTLVPIGWGRTISRQFRETILLKWGNQCPGQINMLINEFGDPQPLAFIAACFLGDANSIHLACREGQACRIGVSSITD